MCGEAVPRHNPVGHKPQAEEHIEPRVPTRTRSPKNKGILSKNHYPIS